MQNIQPLQPQFPGNMTSNARSQSYQSNTSNTSQTSMTGTTEMTETVDSEYPLSLNRTISPSVPTLIQKQDSDQMTELSSVSASTMPRLGFAGSNMNSNMNSNTSLAMNSMAAAVAQNNGNLQNIEER